jgi:hypothetical protein
MWWEARRAKAAWREPTSTEVEAKQQFRAFAGTAFSSRFQTLLPVSPDLARASTIACRRSGARPRSVPSRSFRGVRVGHCKGVDGRPKAGHDGAFCPAAPPHLDVPFGAARLLPSEAAVPAEVAEPSGQPPVPHPCPSRVRERGSTTCPTGAPLTRSAHRADSTSPSGRGGSRSSPLRRHDVVREGILV